MNGGTLQVRNSVVTSPPLSSEQRKSLLDAMDQAEVGSEAGDFLVLIRVMWRVLRADASACRWPVVALQPGTQSLWRASIAASEPEEVSALVRARDDIALAASNVARFVLGLPQQESLLPAFETDEVAEAGSETRPREPLL